jgi:hypothetical protein
MFKNVLFKDRYIISSELQQALNGDPYSTKAKIIHKDFKGVYLVVFRMSKEKSGLKLIYSYINYNPLFLESLLVYLFTKKSTSLPCVDHGQFITIMNMKSMFDIDHTQYDKLYDYYNKEFYEYVKNNENKFKSYESILNIMFKLVSPGDVNKMSDLIDFACNKLYFDFVNSILINFEFYKLFNKDIKTSIDWNKKDHDILRGCLFIVPEIKSLIESIESKGYLVNQGSQAWRGQIDSGKSLLDSIDIDFRQSLYNHNKFHYKKGTIDKNSLLTRDKFSYKCVHRVLGNVRWYSTKRQIKSVSSEILTSRVNRSLEKESIVFKQLSNYLINSPINEETQVNIEKFLLDYSYMSYREEKETDSIIDYKLISNELSLLLINNESILNNYINRVRNKTYSVIPVKQKDNVQYQLSIILKELDNKLILSIMFGRLLRIISNYNKLNTENNFINICTDIGRDIINNYYYSLYFKYMIPKIDVLISNVESLLDKELDSHIKIIYEKVKKIRNRSDKSDLLYYSKLLAKKIIDYNISVNSDILNYTLSNWKYDNKDIVNKFDDILENLLGSRLIDWMIDIGLIKIDLKIRSKKEKENTLVPTDLVINTLKDKDTLINLPHRMPMIVPPKPYRREITNGKSVDRLGGYLLNDENITYNLIIDNWAIKEPTIIKDTNIVFDLVNNISSVGFKINKDVLNFIYTYGIEYNLILDKEYQDPLLTKNRLTKTDKTNLESFLSRKLLQENILGLANVFSNVPEFFIPVRLDYRGRMNCITEYLNYQSTELAKSLLLFSKAENIIKSDVKSINYLKAYGANCFGNKLDKKSWYDRIKWVDDNLNGIINFRDGKLIFQAENKLLFIAFCFEYNRFLQVLYNNEVSYFETHLPIQLDATCNGYQHLSLLSLDYKLADELNLTKSSWNDIPKDFYSFISAKLTDRVRNKLKGNGLSSDKREAYDRLSKITLVRKIVKKAIMNVPYNVTLLKMIEYIKENFKLSDSELNNNISDFKESWYELIDDNNIKLKVKDFNIIAHELVEILNEDVFKLNKLLKYLKEITKICTKLGISIPWALPSGLIVRQSYLEAKEVRLKPFTYSKNSFSLRIADKTKLNSSKQVRAFMPNLIHSLDATSLAMLADLYFNSINGIKNLYAIHDCFAVTANNVEDLMQFLKLVYIKLYSESNYLRLLDRQIIDNIKTIYGKDCFDEETRIVDTKEVEKMRFPNINAVLDKDLDAKFLLGSSYIIS